jgi:hypothetical protein
MISTPASRAMPTCTHNEKRVPQQQTRVQGITCCTCWLQGGGLCHHVQLCFTGESAGDRASGQVCGLVPDAAVQLAGASRQVQEPEPDAGQRSHLHGARARHREGLGRYGGASARDAITMQLASQQQHRTIRNAPPRRFAAVVEGCTPALSSHVVVCMAACLLLSPGLVGNIIRHS